MLPPKSVFQVFGILKHLFGILEHLFGIRIILYFGAYIWYLVNTVGMYQTKTPFQMSTTMIAPKDQQRDQIW